MKMIKRYAGILMMLTLLVGFTSCEDDEDIYDEKIEVFFYEFLRKEQKFESFNHLKEQLQKDKKKCEEKDI